MESIIALVALTTMEIVLGIDNLVVISIVTGKLPQDQRLTARRWGLGIAMVMRIGLLLTIQQIMQLQEPFFHLTDIGFQESWLPDDVDLHRWELMNAISWRDIILMLGGLFLIGKTVHEIHQEIEHQEDGTSNGRGVTSFSSAITQIVIMDLVFSLDSVITAVGMARELWVMIVAVMIAVGAMMAFAGPVSDFVHRHPTLKILALSFLILIGVMLVAEGCGTHVDKGYIYFAMAFSLVVEFLNMRLRQRSHA